MADFFISYTAVDRGWAEWIAWELEEANYSTILQDWDFRPGTNFVDQMQRASTESDRTIAVVTDAYLAASFTRPEWQAAFRGDPTGIRAKLVPVRVAQCELPGMLGSLVYIDMVGLDESTARARLLEGVAEGRGKPLSRPTFPGMRSQGAYPGFPPRSNPPGLNEPSQPPAGFGPRAAALVCDLLVGAGSYWALTAAAGIELDKNRTVLAESPGVPLFILTCAFAGLIILPTWRWGRTSGKLIMGIKVVQTKGGRVSLAQTLIRTIAYIADFPLTFGLGFLMATRGPDYQALHDWIAGTRVLKSPVGIGPRPAQGLRDFIFRWQTLVGAISAAVLGGLFQYILRNPIGEPSPPPTPTSRIRLDYCNQAPDFAACIDRRQ